jgi:predicted O-linked N-acetylglucosamine transferase (SPINDLY family)
MAALAELRNGMRDRLRRSSIMDESGFTRGLERCYTELWQKHLRSREAPTQANGAPVAERLSSARALRESGKLTEAGDVCEAILREDPSQPDALALRWDLAFDSGTPGAAIDWLNRAIARSDIARNHYMLGCVLQSQGKFVAAAASFRASLELDPTSAKAHNNLGCVIEAMGDSDAAEAHYRDAVTLEPCLAPALYNLGNLYRQSGKIELAIDHMKRALAIDASSADWHCNLGELHQQRFELDEALGQFHAAIAIDPGFVRVYAAMADAQLVCGRVAAVGAALDRASEIAPRRSDLPSRSLVLNYFRDQCKPLQLLQQHQSWANRHARGVARWSAVPNSIGGAGHRLNVGYVAADFSQALVVSHVAPVLAGHNREQFNVFGYATTRRDNAGSNQVGGHCNYWRDISQLSDDAAAKRIRADGIDILVDLSGHDTGGRMLLFARKPAPVQVSWLGYPGTTGLATMDYRLTDAVADPIGETESYYVEKLVRLPGSFICYVPERDNADVQTEPHRPVGEIVFGSVNPLAAITDRMIALWSEILGATPKARLLLVADGLRARGVCDELREKFQCLGIAQSRIEMRGPQEPRRQVYDEVDIVLDTVPYNGLTAVCDALWMGVPVVTLAGNTSAARTATSVLTSIGMTDCIAHSEKQYVAIAMSLASNIERRRQLRGQLRSRMSGSRLMDTPTFVRGIEAAFLKMYEASQFPGSESGSAA